jgi:LacI family transcriptional regulator
MPTLGGATAIVAANDQMALGAILALTERGLAVPEDVSVTGTDDIPEAAFFRPPLTTLRIDFEAQGKAAVDQLLERIGHSAPAASAAPTPLLVTRQSTGPVSS